MTRQYIDCREVPGTSGCTLALSADSAPELEEAAVQHAVAVHGEADTPALRAHIRQGMHEGTPPLAAPAQQPPAAPH
jgi:predicted small metal-binding protein